MKYSKLADFFSMVSKWNTSRIIQEQSTREPQWCHWRQLSHFRTGCNPILERHHLFPLFSMRAESLASSQDCLWLTVTIGANGPSFNNKRLIWAFHDRRFCQIIWQIFTQGRAKKISSKIAAVGIHDCDLEVLVSIFEDFFVLPCFKICQIIWQKRPSWKTQLLQPFSACITHLYFRPVTVFGVSTCWSSSTVDH